MKKIDLTGRKFKHLTVIRQSQERRNGLILWECLCDCGNTIDTVGYYLKKGHPNSCGCVPIQTRKEDLTGQKFGKLTVLEEAPKKQNRIQWKCLCDCGNNTIVFAHSIKSGKTKSCGCLRTEIGTNLVGQTFGKLTVIKKNIERRYVQRKGAVWDCICSCGKSHTVNGYSLRTGASRSCGCLQKELVSARGKQRGCEHLRGYEQDRVDGIVVCSLTRGMLRSNTSGYKGVSKVASTGKWRAYITINDKQKNLGQYEDIQDAIQARQEAEKEIFKPIIDKYEEAGGKKKRKRS